MKRKINPQANNNNKNTFFTLCDAEKASLQSLNNFKRPFKTEYINFLLPQKLTVLFVNLQGTFLLAKIPKPNNSEKPTGFRLKDISNQHQGEDASPKKNRSSLWASLYLGLSHPLNSFLQEITGGIYADPQL